MKSPNKKELVEKTLRWISERELFRGGERVVCALSGGADSVAMTLLLSEISEELGISVSAAHVNHMLRGAEADRDEEFCRSFCRERGIPFTALRGDAAELAKKLGAGTEEAARELRYGLLFSLDADVIAAAHNADDNLETVVMRLARGGGARGLSGIPPKNGMIVRPIMCLTREETEAVCREFRADYVTDSTNSDDAYTRNRLRHGAVRELRELNPAVSGLVLANSIRLREEDEFLDSLALKKLNENGGVLDVELLKNSGSVLSRRILRIAALRAGAELDGQTTEKLLSLSLTGKTRFSYDVSGMTYFGEYGKFFFLRKNEKSGDFDFSLSPGKAVVTGEWRVEMGFSSERSENIYRIFNIFEIDSDKIQGELCVRNARPEDTFKRNRGSGTKKLRRLYSDMKLPMEERTGIPVLADGGGVLFVPGIGANAAREIKGTGERFEIIFERKSRDSI